MKTLNLNKRIVCLLLLLIPALVVNGFTNNNNRRYLSSGVPTNLHFFPARTSSGAPTRPSLSVHYANSALFTTESTSSSTSTRSLNEQQQQQQHALVVNNNRHSASDWLYNARSILQSEILREVRGPVLAVAAWSLVVSLVHHWARHRLPAMAAHMSIPGTAHSFLVSAIGLLLVFRTNSAYQRFYEGRKIWENILSISRNISRMVQLYATEIGHSRQRRIRNLVAAFPYLLRHHIRPGCLCANQPVKDDRYRLRLYEPSLPPAVETRHEGDQFCGGGRGECSTTSTSTDVCEPPRAECYVDKRNLPWSLLPSKSLPKVAVAHNRPLWVCDRIGKSVMNVPYGPNFTSRERLALLGQVEKLTNAVGQCERIHQTAVPVNYARHSLRSLTLWLFTLPFCLIKDLGLLTAPVTACIAWILFGVYQIGYSIEDPFQGSLRLSILCDAIRRDVVGEAPQAVQQQQAPEPESYLMSIETDMGTSQEQDGLHVESNSSQHHHHHHEEEQEEQFHFDDQQQQNVLPLLEQTEEAFLKVVPKLVVQENNGTWKHDVMVEHLVREGP